MTQLIERLSDGLTNGFVYALIALALVVVFKASSTVNFAQAEMALFTTYVAWWMTTRGISIWLALLAACVVGFIIGAAIERTLVRPAEKRGEMPTLLILVALFTAINAIDGLIWGLEYHSMDGLFPAGLDDYVSVASARIYYEDIGVWAAAIIALAVCFMVINKTRLGLLMRAAADNPASAALSGINVGKVYTFGWGSAAVIGSIAGILIAPISPHQLSMATMFPVLIYGSAAAIIGGLNSLGGAVVGGLTLGLAESLITGYVGFIGPQLHQTTALAVMVIVLLVRPTGIFGSRRLERV
ncbi:branched-chain amino acid ABC transporter permease [Aeromicrobium sp. PE09-221]|uniref:branched-chain amino acid ABC transporter permease n=1 Tax=Aeromicrobium sp. PE09-221 TaxID=1898043 RepID=UPI000B3E77F4|nr:branched-chain amino acid ABC transporter permease [Aeromicrobium sp. PE09-221]OUZ07663.1 branched-chain amino acid ABC transporter permease [Aeromicrobium sp. PE09-221]